MKKKQVVLLILAIAIIMLAAMAIVQPTRDFGPPAEDAPAEVRESAQTVVAALERTGRLPPPGTQLVRRNGILEWEAVPQSAPEITAVQVSRMRLTSGASLLRSLLDDDPTYSAEADVIVTTEGQSRTMLRVALWDYGLLTPWSIKSKGDGLKPIRVSWN